MILVPYYHTLPASITHGSCVHLDTVTILPNAADIWIEAALHCVIRPWLRDLG
jgi:hypothetical protein